MSEQFASTNIAERAGIANYEQVLQEDNKFGEYKIKALPAVKKPSQFTNSISAGHQKNFSNSTMGMLLQPTPPPFPVQIVTDNDTVMSEQDGKQQFGPDQMK